MRQLSIAILSLCIFLVPAKSKAQSLIGGIINSYWPVTSVDFCNNRVALPMIAVGINIGDKVMLIQMQGALIDTSDSPSYGTVVDYNHAGTYELLTVSDVTNNIISFQEAMLFHYNDLGKVQLVLLPQYTDVNVVATLIAQPWNGSTGGVLGFIASGSVTMNADIDATGIGFRGGSVIHDGFCFAGGLGFTGYRCNIALQGGGNKGEGIAGSLYQNLGRGAPANGGGGGNDSNTGGGGGSNAAAGGNGGQRLNVTTGCAGDHPGIGGYSLNYSNTDNQIFPGGGGGAGDDNSNGGTSGGNGGGIVFIRANDITGNGFNILSRGADATPVIATLDGAGGGGGGGAVLLDVNTITATTVSVNGGLGGSTDNGVSGADSCFGPGGGGGAGMIWFKGASIPPIPLETNGNASGTTSGAACSGSANGATDGSSSNALTGLLIPESTVLFVPLTLSVSNDTTVCEGTPAFLSASASGTGTITYDWSHGASTDTSTTIVTEPSTFQVIATDSRGCSLAEILEVDVISTSTTAYAFPDSIVQGYGVVYLSCDTGGNEFFVWDPPAYLNDPNIFNPVSTPEDTITYCVEVTGYNGCKDTACVDVLVVIPKPAIHIPTAFTPNGDGINDTWQLIVHECYAIEDVSVWNRWGMLIYNYKIAGGKEWNGTYLGQPQALETYFYYIKARCNERNEIEEYVGNVTIIR